jgi:hypothetical protein
MLPWCDHHVVRMLHEERIRAAKMPHPEWWYEERLAPRPSIAQRLGQWWRSLKREDRSQELTHLHGPERVVDAS